MRDYEFLFKKETYKFTDRGDSISYVAPYYDAPEPDLNVRQVEDLVVWLESWLKKAKEGVK